MSETGLHSILGVKPDLHLQWKAPAVFMQSVDATSHCDAAHSLMSEQNKNMTIEET